MNAPTGDILHSAIYRGHVVHRRTAPVEHAFASPLFMLYLDLDELDRVFAGSGLWGIGTMAVASFHRRDYLGDPHQPLAEAVRDLVAERLGERPTGPIRLLTHVRYCGYCFNPVSFYYCFASDGVTLDAIVAHITNTPWGERHAYVLRCSRQPQHKPSPQQRFYMSKAFHISPFMSMEQDYAWTFGVPGDRLGVHMENRVGGTAIFHATLALERQPATAGNLARMLLRFPFITLQVIARIHLQAARLWWKGVPFHSHPTTGAHTAAAMRSSHEVVRT